jgi:hypothetical protein
MGIWRRFSYTMIKLVSSRDAKMVQQTEIKDKHNTSHSRVNDRNHMIVSVDVEKKSFDKIQ